MKYRIAKIIRMTLGVSFCLALTLSAETRQPNVLYFALDDMNDWIGAMGYEQAVTPNIDRLAAEGVTFVNAQTAGVYCAPSRSALALGQHATTTGCYTRNP